MKMMNGQNFKKKKKINEKKEGKGGKEKDRALTVSTWPGSTSSTRTREAMSSWRRALLKLWTAALVAQ